jgi:hypothetical protein
MESAGRDRHDRKSADSGQFAVNLPEIDMKALI